VLCLVKKSQIVGMEDDLEDDLPGYYNTTWLESSCHCWDGRSREESHGRNSPRMFRPLHLAGHMAEIRGCLELLKLLKFLD